MEVEKTGCELQALTLSGHFCLPCPILVASTPAGCVRVVECEQPLEPKQKHN
jgi:hypothetical protein